MDIAADNVGSHVSAANTGAVGIVVVGKYGTDGQNTWMDALDGGIQKPTNASMTSVKNLVDWIAFNYNINKTGQTQLQPVVNGQESCQLSPDLCWVNNIAGHSDYPAKTETEYTVYPVNNIYDYLSSLRGGTPVMPGGVMPGYTAPKGILIAGLSPVVLGVVDPSGKRTGIDPAPGAYVNNIAGATHGSFASLFDVQDEKKDKSYGINVTTTANGVYKIDVVGTGTGTFHLATEDIGTVKARVMKGTTTAGKKDNYQMIYSTANPSALELFHDTVPPVTTGKMTCSRDTQGVCRSNATVNLTATDTGTNGDPSSGVAKIECSHDNKVTWQQCGTTTGVLTFK